MAEVMTSADAHDAPPLARLRRAPNTNYKTHRSRRSPRGASNRTAMIPSPRSCRRGTPAVASGGAQHPAGGDEPEAAA